MAIDEKILAKIKKCLALTSSSSPHEAAAALARAQEMMAKYNVSAEQLEGAKTDTTVVEERVRSVASASRCKVWELRLFTTVATTFGCELMFARGQQRKYGATADESFARYILVGTREDALVAKYAAEVLLRQLTGARAKFTRDLPSYYNRQRKTKEVDAYCLGWVAGASVKVKSLREARVDAAKEHDKAHGTSTALVVLSQEEQRQAALVKYVQTTARGEGPKAQQRWGGSDFAKAKGYEDGLQATVNRAVGSATSKADIEGR